MPSPPPDRIAELLALDAPEWFRDGVLLWLATGDPLPQCLGVSRADAQRHLRDYHLCELYLELDAETGGWRRTVAVAAEIQKFETTTWPRLSALDAPDPSWSRLRRHLWGVLGSRAPTIKARRIYDILQSRGLAIAMDPGESTAENIDEGLNVD